ncbi:MAG: J domain-containing protein, partial [Victivallaceae bacterium]
MKKNNYKKPAKKAGRPPKSKCTALIPLDTRRIREEYLKTYRRRKKSLEKIEAELQIYNESDEPEFQKFMALRLGAELTRAREVALAISQAHMRYEKITMGARAHGVSKGRYCYNLAQQMGEASDFWAALDQDLLVLQEAERKRTEEFERRFNDFRNEPDDEVDDDKDDGGFNDEDFDRAKEEFRKLFGGIFGDNVIEFEDDSDQVQNDGELKRLYRELCIRYHPDKFGAHDQKTQRLWISIQEAYQDGDHARLRAIHAGIEMESGKKEISCSDIWVMIDELEWTIRNSRCELRNLKQRPYWGFGKWDEKQ